MFDIVESFLCTQWFFSNSRFVNKMENISQSLIPYFFTSCLARFCTEALFFERSISNIGEGIFCGLP